MPFTPAHAVVALPFASARFRGLSRGLPGAVAVGAMTPDLPLFVRLTPVRYALTHSFAWLPLTIALALGLLLVWRCVLRPAARELSPGWLATRLPEGWDARARAGLRETFAAGPRGMLLLIACLAAGIASHIVWDLFTHEGRWGVEAIPALDDRWGPVAGYTWLQHGSSALGLTVVAGCAALWLSRRTPAAIARLLPGWVRRVWWMSLPLVLVTAWVWGLVAFGPLTAEWTPAHLAYRVLPSACALWGAASVALCAIVQLRSGSTDGDTPGARARFGRRAS